MSRENQWSLEEPEQQRAVSSVLTRLLIAGWGSSSEAGHVTQVTGPREADV